MPDIPLQLTSDELPLTFQAADADGDEFENDGNVNIHATGPATGWSLVFENGRDSNFGEHPPYTLAVAAGSTTIVSSRFSKFRFNQSNGKINVTYLPSEANITIAALKSNVHLEDE